jgi:hypothetical protein
MALADAAHVGGNGGLVDGDRLLQRGYQRTLDAT